MASSWNDQLEWLETDGLGGFASGTAGGIRTRRYHGLLLAATTPPTGRIMLVNGLEVFVDTSAGSCPLSSHRYDGQVIHPEGFRFIRSFTTDPWPTWRIHLPDGTVIEHELFVAKHQPTVVLSWRVCDGRGEGIRLRARPLMSGRDYHALHRENPSLQFDADVSNQRVRWRPYASVPGICSISNGDYMHEPQWYRNFFYQEEWLRGFEAVEDLASPGFFRFDLARGEALLVLSAETSDLAGSDLDTVAEGVARLRAAEMRRRQSFETPLHRAADQYLVRRGRHKTIIAGYPWFADWGRDTFVSVRGLCLATGRLAEARQILLAWAAFVSEGMLPNRFPDAGEQPEYNSVDASLWYVIAVEEFTRAAADADFALEDADLRTLREAGDSILSGYAVGTRYGIHADEDGLLAAGHPGVQLTWMDAKIGDWVVTPRVGKPVEVQALWLNALALVGDRSPRRRSLFERGRETFRRRFWNEAGQCLYDVVDCDGRPGAVDATFRPNQIFAVGGLPVALLEGERARRLVDQVERKLWTPLGLRSLASNETGYTPRYSGGPRDRDAAYHQGTVWPWLAGPFVEAWVRVRGDTAEAKREARRRLVEPLMRHLNDAGLNHVSEIADAEAPHMPRGCPFQAWSVAELLRLDAVLSPAPAVKPEAAWLHPMCG
jgi:predicted glycogen debranching enzyme